MLCLCLPVCGCVCVRVCHCIHVRPSTHPRTHAPTHPRIHASTHPRTHARTVIRRFTRRILIPLPDAAARQALVDHLLKGQRRSTTQSDMIRLTKETEGYSASDLRAVCNHAAMAPIRELGSRVAQVRVPPCMCACICACLRACLRVWMRVVLCDECTSAMHVCSQAHDLDVIQDAHPPSALPRFKNRKCDPSRARTSARPPRAAAPASTCNF